MKNYIIKYTTILLFCSVAILSACKKQLNAGPIDTPTDATFWTSEVAAKTGLAGAYGLLRAALTNQHSYFIFGDATANEFTFPLDGNLASLSSNNQWSFSGVGYYDGSLKNWTDFYQAISQCNLIMSKVPTIPNGSFTDNSAITKNQIIGEAYFIRAYCYFYLTEAWGKPVIVTQSYTDPINAAPVPRSTDAQGYAQAVADLKKSISLLQYGYSNATNVAVQANKSAAFALLSKVYMWQKQYQLASDAADSVINHNDYKLEPGATYGNIFKGHDQESIFEMNMLYSPTQNEAQNGNDGMFSIFLGDPFVNGQKPSWIVNSDLVNNLYDTSDTTTDIRVKTIFYGLASVNTLMVKYANVIYQNPGQQTQPFVSNNLVLLRLADIYLIKAEANYYLGNYGMATQNLNMTITRAGNKPYAFSDPQDLLYTIMDERGREFFGEGQWFFDLVRSGLIDDANYGNSIDGYLTTRVNGGGCQWPLDLRTLLPQDPLLTQNPWWGANTN